MPSIALQQRRRAPEDVPSPLIGRVFDPDDLGAERCQEAGRAGSRQLTAEVADAHVAQRGRRGRRNRVRILVSTGPLRLLASTGRQGTQLRYAW